MEYDVFVSVLVGAFLAFDDEPAPPEGVGELGFGLVHVQSVEVQFDALSIVVFGSIRSVLRFEIR